MAETSSVIHNTNVYLHRYDSNSKKYQQQGDGALGCVLLGAGIEYQLLLYNAQKETMCKTSISATFRCILQPKNYVNFYDETGGNWSMRFKDEAESSGFMRAVAYLKTHLLIWGSSATDNKILKHDFILGSGTPVSTGDTVGIILIAWKMVGSAASKPLDVTSHPAFDQTVNQDLRKIKLGDLSYDSHLPGLHDGIVGMLKNGKRLIVIPPAINRTSNWYLIEVTVMKIKAAKRNSEANISSPVKAAPVAVTTSPEKLEHDELVNRMAKLSRAGSGNRSGILAHMNSSPSGINSTADVPQSPSRNVQTPVSHLNVNPTPLMSPPAASAPTSAPSSIRSIPHAEAIVPYDVGHVSSYPTSSNSTYSSTTGVDQRLLEQRAKLQQQQEELAAQRRALDRTRLSPTEHHDFRSSNSVSNPVPSRRPSYDPVLGSSTYDPPRSTSSSSYRYGNREITPVSTTSLSSSAPSSSYQTELLQRIKTSNQTLEDMVSDVSAKLDRLIFSQSRTGADSYSSASGSFSSSNGSGSMHSASLLKGVERLVKENERINKEISERSDQVGSLESRVEEVLGKNHQLMLENTRLSERSSSAQQQHSTFNSQLKLAQTEKKNADAQIERLKKDLEDLHESFDQSRRQTEEQQEQQMEYEKQGRSRLEEKLQRETQRAVNLERQVLHLKQHGDDERKAAEHEYELKLETIRAKHSTELLHMNAQLEEARAGVEQLESTKKKVVESRSVAQSIQQDLNEAHKENDQLRAQLQQALTDMSEANNTMQRMTENEHERNVLDASHMEELKRLEAEHQQELEAVRKEYENMPQDTSLASENESLQSQVRELEDRLEDYETKNEDLSREIVDLKDGLAERANVATLLEKELAQVRSEYEEKLQEPRGHSSDAISELCKDMMNEIYFKFQDTFEEEHEYSGKEVIVSVRKILKQNTGDMLKKIDAL